jgi:hypothetical protein
MIPLDQIQCSLYMECAVHKVQKDHSATNIKTYLNHWLIADMTEQKNTSRYVEPHSTDVLHG